MKKAIIIAIVLLLGGYVAYAQNWGGFADQFKKTDTPKENQTQNTNPIPTPPAQNTSEQTKDDNTTTPPPTGVSVKISNVLLARVSSENRLTISGSGFTATSNTIYIDQQKFEGYASTNQQIKFVVPASFGNGQHTVYIKNSNGVSNTESFNISVPQVWGDPPTNN